MPVFHLTQASTLLPVVTALTRRGIRIEDDLRRARIPAKLLRQAYAPIPKRTHFWQFLDAISAQEGMETIGFLLGDPLDLEMTGPWGRNLLRSVTLFDALNKASRTIRHFAQGNSIAVRRDGDRASISIVNEDPVMCRAADHTGMKFLLTLVEMVADPGWQPARATLRTGRLEAVEALPVFSNCDLTFSGTGASLEIPEDYLSRLLPPRRDGADTGGMQLFQLPEDGRVSSKLKLVLATFLPHYGPLPVEEAAEILGISRTTLFRQLTVEGESYRNLIDKVRYSAACQLLTAPSLSVKEISYALGYGEPNNFTRAFHRVAGIPPGEYRRRSAEMERVLPGA